MRRRLWPWVIVALGVMIVVLPRWLRAPPELTPVTPADLVAVLPAAARWIPAGGDRRHLRGLDTDGRTVGLVFRTTELPPPVRGYVDEIDLLVGLDPTGRVAGVRLLGHRESAAYMAAVRQAGFLDAWAGRDLTRGEVPDAVTGATVSCEAMQRDVLAGGQDVAAGVLGLPVRTVRAADAPPLALGVWLRFGLLGALILLAFVGALRPGLSFLRGLSLAGSVALVGLLLDAPLALVQALELLRLRWPDPGRPETLLLLAACAAPLLLGANVYCDRLCPFRGLLEASRRLLPLGRAGVPPPGWGLRWARRLRPWLTLAALGAALGLQLEAPTRVEPWVGLFSGAGSGRLWLGFVAVTLLASAWAPGLWCRGFCPTGALLDGLVWLRATSVGRWLRRRGVAPSSPSGASREPAPASPSLPAPEGRAEGTASTRRRRLLGPWLWLAAWLAVLGLGLAQALTAPPSAPAALAEVMQRFDAEQLREAIEEGRLVRHPARWSRPLPPDISPDARPDLRPNVLGPTGPEVP